MMGQVTGASVGDGGHRVNEPCQCESCAAFHAAGIKPSDLPIFVDAVRAIYAANAEGIRRIDSCERFPCNQFNDAIGECLIAAARLPENRKS